MIEQGSKYCTSPYCTNLARPGRKICWKCKARRYTEKYPLENTYRFLKANAKRRGIVCTLTLEEWKQFCDATNYLKLRGTYAQDMTVDRINPSLGYIAGNLQMLTRSENAKKAVKERKKALFQGLCPRQNDDPF